jgi:hypothetical protein
MDPVASMHKILHKSRRSETETLATIRQAFEEESMSRTRKEKSKITKTEKYETSGEQSQEHAHNFL